VVYRVAKSLHHLGLPVLRFNFRGAGRSEGAHDQGRGEQADVAAALDFLAAEFPGKPVVLGGFSFGAFVGLRVACTDARVARVIGLGLPVNRWDMSPLRDCVKPKLLIQGGNDEYGSAANVESLFVSLGEPKRLVIVPGADHFFAGGLERVDEAIRSWMTPPALQ
jgi:alpha/beta superfamily hydrolase